MNTAPITSAVLAVLAVLSAALAAAALASACVPAYDTADSGATQDSGLADAAAPGDGGETDGGTAPDAMMTFPDALPRSDSALPDTGPIDDMDHDGLPDDEDPAPNAANTLLLRDGFETDSMGWIFTSVSMGIDTGRGVLREGTFEPYVREGWVGPRPAWFDYYARTIIHVMQVGGSSEAGSGRAGLMARVNQVTPDRYLFCAIDLKTHSVVITEHQGGDPGGLELASAPIPLHANEWTLLAVSVKGNGVTCRAGSVEVTAASTAFTTGAIGFRAFDAAFEADLLEVFAL